MLKSLTIALALSVVSIAASAGDFKLTHGGVYNLEMPSVALSYDGEARDVSKFYKPSNEQFYLGGKYTFDNKRTTISTTYDNGYHADKLSIQKSARIGIQHHYIVTQNSYISVGGSYKFGGDTKHTSCTDNYDREYYCGNATAWSDFDQKGSADGEDYTLGIRFTFKF